MSWDIIPHSWVLIAKEVEGNFYKMIKVGNRRSNITVLMNLQIHLPCQVMLRPGLLYTHGTDPRPLRGSQFSFLGTTPGCCRAAFQVLACSTAPAWYLCDYPGPGAGPLSWTSPHSQSTLHTFFYSQRASYCLWNCCSGSGFPVPHTTDSQLLNWVQGPHTKMT